MDATCKILTSDVVGIEVKARHERQWRRRDNRMYLKHVAPLVEQEMERGRIRRAVAPNAKGGHTPHSRRSVPAGKTRLNPSTAGVPKPPLSVQCHAKSSEAIQIADDPCRNFLTVSDHLYVTPLRTERRMVATYLHSRRMNYRASSSGVPQRKPSTLPPLSQATARKWWNRTFCGLDPMKVGTKRTMQHSDPAGGTGNAHRFGDVCLVTALR